ncbi:MAG TPA: hypothetical protein VLW65_08015 [Bryobacteraceae bacterium]|nr:hypothetical protein [Bryobacteraceae bacterium]
MTGLQEQWTGVCLAGDYTLRQYLGEAGDDAGTGAFFAAVSSSGEPVLLKLVPASAGAGDRLMLWRRTAHLQHPNLLRLLDCGRESQAALGGGCLYAVFEWPDDHLTDALEQGPLGGEEAREFLLAALDALRYLHAQGLVHGSIDAANVVAVGNTIKLSTGNLREPDSARFSYADDIAALGALLGRILTGHEFGAATAHVDEPFATILRNTAGAKPADRWTIPEILAALGPPAPAAAEPAAAPPCETVPAAPPIEPQPVAAEPLPRARTQRVATSHVPIWAWPVSLAVLAGCFAWVVHTPAPKAQPVPIAPVYAPPPAAKSAAPETAPQPVEPAAPHERAVWRVIAYTYNAWRDAEKKALAINRKWPGLNADVFAPKGVHTPPYLVALGGRMDRLEAARVLQKARSRGLPRDTFMLNFSD